MAASSGCSGCPRTPCVGTAARRVAYRSGIVSAYSDSPFPWQEISPRLSRLGERVATFYELPGNLRLPFPGTLSHELLHRLFVTVRQPFGHRFHGFPFPIQQQATHI